MPRRLPRPLGWLERFGRFGAVGEHERVLTERGELRVRDRAGFREMVACDGAGELVWTRAELDDPRRSGWPYVELFHVAAALATQ